MGEARREADDAAVRVPQLSQRRPRHVKLTVEEDWRVRATARIKELEAELAAIRSCTQPKGGDDG